jgi:hypothetical protein
MKKLFKILVFIVMLAVWQMTSGNSFAAQSGNLFGLLPLKAQNEIREVRNACNEIGLKKPYPLDDDGLSEIDLNGDGSRDIVVDWKYVACGRPSYGCSNRGCTLEIYRQTGRNSWKKVFSEQVIQYFMSATYRGRFRLLAVSIVGGNSRCKAPPVEPISHAYCDALVFWKGHWVWEPIK